MSKPLTTKDNKAKIVKLAVQKKNWFIVGLLVLDWTLLLRELTRSFTFLKRSSIPTEESLKIVFLKFCLS